MWPPIQTRHMIERKDVRRSRKRTPSRNGTTAKEEEQEDYWVTKMTSSVGEMMSTGSASFGGTNVAYLLKADSKMGQPASVGDRKYSAQSAKNLQHVHSTVGQLQVQRISTNE
ncbi:hypothetical protein ANCDUO_11696 [Ancylostoma duodenale]|uniref:Uncharacterized protein n=1 Tax=Ancylostoma duodenale TaxID=51022 RepID=A0A0C2GGW8_9BILA|nr:hypothetical protein ANCDUO_11696 [Ancylostoma duodenale]